MPLYLKKTSLVIAGIAIIIGTCILGFSYNDLPEFSAKKYLMPAIHRVNLRATNYKIWYFRNETRQEEELNNTKSLQSPKVKLPKLSIEDLQGGQIKWKIDSKDIADHSISTVIPLGEVEIEHAGVYLLSATFGSDEEKFLIALVPPTAENRQKNTFPIFYGELDKPIESR